jgi:ubiquinone/menaquinone biosynthesis C-methylase UbiE
LSEPKESVHRRIKDFYEKKPYGGTSPPQEIRLRYKVIRDQIIRHGRPSILEVGCGNGSLSRAIEDIVKNYVGIDISRHAIQIARRSSKRGDFLVASACGLPFKNESTKLILCSEVLEHIPDYWVAIQEMSRVLESGRCLIVTTPNLYNPCVLFSSLFARLRGVSRTCQIYDKPIPYHRLLSTLHNSGMEVISIDSFYSHYTPARLSLKRILFIIFEQLIKILVALIGRPHKVYLILVARKRKASGRV